jgi:ParB family chromosome partitioning protein
MRLFAHCVAQGVNAVHEAWNRRPRAFAHADRLAEAVDLDMAAEGWTPTVDGYLGRVTKARILQAVAEGRGQRDADRIEHFKKGEMAEQAQALLANTAWLPDPLRTPGRALPDAVEATEPEAEIADEVTVEETAVDGGEPAMADEEQPAEDEEVAFEPHAIAAE